MKEYDFADLVDIMKTLRSEKGCPWDREQSHESILQCLVEEAYEFIEAVHLKDFEHMKEELGDVLLQVIFHSHLAGESGHFTIKEVINSLCEKLVRRHPHVFGSQTAYSAEGVVKIWDQVKNNEEGKYQESLLASIAPGLPPLQKAHKIQKKVKTVGFEWEDVHGPFEKLKEEMEELKHAIIQDSKSDGTSDEIENELGDVFFSLVNIARHLGVDPSSALEKTNLKFTRRFRKMEELLKREKKDIRKQKLEVLEEYWQKAKSDLAS